MRYCVQQPAATHSICRAHLQPRPQTHIIPSPCLVSCQVYSSRYLNPPPRSIHRLTSHRLPKGASAFFFFFSSSPLPFPPNACAFLPPCQLGVRLETCLVLGSILFSASLLVSTKIAPPASHRTTTSRDNHRCSGQRVFGPIDLSILLRLTRFLHGPPSLCSEPAPPPNKLDLACPCSGPIARCPPPSFHYATLPTPDRPTDVDPTDHVPLPSSTTQPPEPPITNPTSSALISKASTLHNHSFRPLPEPAIPRPFSMFDHSSRLT